MINSKKYEGLFKYCEVVLQKRHLRYIISADIDLFYTICKNFYIFDKMYAHKTKNLDYRLLLGEYPSEILKNICKEVKNIYDFRNMINFFSKELNEILTSKVIGFNEEYYFILTKIFFSAPEITKRKYKKEVVNIENLIQNLQEKYKNEYEYQKNKRIKALELYKKQKEIIKR